MDGIKTFKKVIETILSKIPEDRYGSILREYFSGTLIEELSYYKRAKEERKQGIKGWEDKSDTDIRKAINDFIKFYGKIKREGWYCSMHPRYHIKGKIFRDGRIQITHGHHRLSILKYLKYEFIKIYWTVEEGTKDTILKSIKTSKRVIKINPNKIPEDWYGKILEEYFSGTKIEDLTHYKNAKIGIGDPEDWWGKSDTYIKEMIIDFIEFYKKIKREGWYHSRHSRYYMEGIIHRDGSLEITHGHRRLSILKYMGIENVKILWKIEKGARNPF